MKLSLAKIKLNYKLGTKKCKNVFEVHGMKLNLLFLDETWGRTPLSQ
jgi:hypothetical protein